jgi:hypothetical protein
MTSFFMFLALFALPLVALTAGVSDLAVGGRIGCVLNAPFDAFLRSFLLPSFFFFFFLLLLLLLLLYSLHPALTLL